MGHGHAGLNFNLYDHHSLAPDDHSLNKTTSCGGSCSRWLHQETRCASIVDAMESWQCLEMCMQSPPSDPEIPAMLSSVFPTIRSGGRVGCDEFSSNQHHPVVATANGCNYRGGGVCPNARACKENGDSHSLCALHRSRTIVNQRRYDDKMRTKKTMDTKKAVLAPVKKVYRSRAMKTAIPLHALPQLFPRTPSAVSILPSFKEWSATLNLVSYRPCKRRAARVTTIPRKIHQSIGRSTRYTRRSMAMTDRVLAFTAWHEIVLTPFLLEQ